MPIGDSKGAFYKDEFQQEAAPWFGTADDNVVSPLEIMPGGVENNVVNPRTLGASKDLDKWELDPSTGTGLEVGFKTQMNQSPNVEDRRSQDMEWSFNRLADPTDLKKEPGGNNSEGLFKTEDNPEPAPTALSWLLGMHDLDKITIDQFYKRLGIEPVKEEKSINTTLAPMPKDKDPILMTKP